jgi:PAS domain S-box-containing protein
MSTRKKDPGISPDAAGRHLLAGLDGIDDVIYVADPESYELLQVNKAFERTWGVDAVGKKCFRVLQGRQKPCPFCTNDRILGENEGKTHVWERQNEVTGRWYRCSDKAIRWVDGRMVRFELATDVTEQKKVELALRERVKELTCVQQVSAMIRRDGITSEQVVEETARLLCVAVLHPGSAVARVRLGDAVRQTGDVDSCVANLTAEVKAPGGAVGSVTVGYTEQHAEADQGPFLDEERALIEVVAEMLGAYTTRTRALGSLRQQQDDLESQIQQRTADLTRQTAALEGLATELVTIMDALPGLVFYKDANNRFMRVNRYLADAYKKTKEELEGTSLFDLYPREQAQAYLDDDLEVIRSGRAKLNIVEPWGTETGARWVSTSKMPYLDVQGHVIGIIGVSMDITELKEAERALERKSRITTAINRMFREALTCDSVEAVAQSALRVTEELTGSKFGFIGEINAQGKYDTIGISNPGWDACAIPDSTAAMLIKNMELRGIWATVLKSGAATIVNDPSSAPDRVGVPEGHPELTSFLGVPFLRDGRAVGMVALANKAGGYDDEDLEAVETLAVAFYEALLRKRLEVEANAQAKVKAAQAELSRRMAGDLAVAPLCDLIISFLCDSLQVPTGLMYVADERGTLRMVGSYAHKRREGLTYEYGAGEGLVGQAASAQKTLVLDDVPSEYFTIQSGLGEMRPRFVFIKPIVRNGRVRAVLELGFLKKPGDDHATLLDVVNEGIAAAIESAQAREAQSRLLEEARSMTEELQAQQEELKAANEELEEQTQRLQDSEARLKAQQEELQVTNEELEEKTELLERQKRDVEQARRQVEEKVEEVALASRYKSEFLANMSHELRTPLNSLLLLSRSLSENKQGNLTGDQVESAQVIHQGGNDLLSLINDILDLSKIEAGRMELRFEEVLVSDLAASVRASFQGLAEQKGIEFAVATEPGAPARIISDRKLVEQVLKNLVANAVKFTEAGHVKVTFGLASADPARAPVGLVNGDMLRVRVEDTGVGIPVEQHKAVFEAFQQGDGSTARRFGGTGLGLSIVRQLAGVLGGEVRLESKPGEGSIFTADFPVEREATATKPRAHSRKPDLTDEGAKPPRQAPSHAISDDRDTVTRQDRSVLIIEDDVRFAEILAKHCRERGFKVLASATGEAGIELARRFGPCGILLDLKLPEMDGWRVLEILKDDPSTRHIPVHIASVEAPTAAALRRGAIGHMQKPVTTEQIGEALAKLNETSQRKTKRVLVVEDDEGTRRGIVDLIADHEVAVDEAAGGDQAIEALRSRPYDCMVLDLGLWDCDGKELLERIEREEGITVPPVIVYTARELTWEEDLDLRSHSSAVVIKGVRSAERLIDEVSLFLHRVVADMPEKKRQVITNLHDADALLRGKKVLLVDDDMRALFALTRILSERGMRVLKAENGEKALKALEQETDVDIVLMDVMMPVLDGYETMKRIRAQQRFAKLPIVALTAKAMRGDREHCIEAGANDYLPKPVDEDRLVSMLRVWLYR